MIWFLYEVIDSEFNYSGSNNINGWGQLFEIGILKLVHIYRSVKSKSKYKTATVNVKVIQINEKKKVAINYIKC